ncbi:MAG: FAD-binding protein [Tissierellia bacterium]|nr:FAD-binding protein [Tissierellia bacterium]
MRSDFSTGPYYGVESSVENHTNHGGIVVDIDNHALNADGEIIPGLFAAGECSASHIQGWYTYQDCIENGRISAKVAFEEMNQN